MVRIPDRSRDRVNDLDSTMTPMIDVVFLLLIFFVWTAGTQVVEYLVQNRLSAPMGNQPSRITDPTPEQDFDQVVIRLRWDDGLPDWSINDQPLASMDDVTRTLQTLADINSTAPIVIHPDPPVPLGYVIQLYDESRLAGFSKISFAVNRDGP